MKTKFLIVLTLMFFLMFTFCNRETPFKEEPKGKISFKFEHLMNGVPVKYDTLCYTNEAGNTFMINQIQYFISDIKLHNTNGKEYTLNDFYHYVDKDIPASLIWMPSDSIPVSTYDKIIFTFGFSVEKNKSGMFVNAPESNMEWPDMLGGGYHYMKINLKFEDSTQYLQNFNFHLGIGQNYDVSGNVTGFVNNSFEVLIPNIKFDIEKNKTKTIKLNMNIENWFKSPNKLNFCNWNNCIMQKQAGIKQAVENGKSVFTASNTN